MELIKEICLENDVVCNHYKIRKAARSIAFNSEGKIPLLNVSKENYHKLAGGGIEQGEDIITALKRELLEEVGANIGELEEIGVIVEYRNKHELLQFSYYYKSKIIGNLIKTSFTQEEKNNGFMLEWKTLDEAIALLENDKPMDYDGKYIVERDLTFLQHFKKYYI